MNHEELKPNFYCYFCSHKYQDKFHPCGCDFNW